MLNHKPFARDIEVNADMKWIARPMMAVRSLDQHAATGNAAVVAIEPLEFRANPGGNSVRPLDISKSDLQREIRRGKRISGWKRVHSRRDQMG
jgi:hypothetical protein